MLLSGVAAVTDSHGDARTVAVGERADKKTNYLSRRMKVGKVR